jgi:hypothetical protein
LTRFDINVVRVGDDFAQLVGGVGRGFPALQRKNAIEILKYIVPWCIAQNGLAYSKKLAVDTFKKMVIAICDDQGLFQGFPLAAAQAKSLRLVLWALQRKLRMPLITGAYRVHTFSVQSFA